MTTASIALTADAVKTCACGRQYALPSSADLTGARWSALTLVGYDDNDPTEPLEMRNCRGCGSTMAIRIMVRERRIIRHLQDACAAAGVAYREDVTLGELLREARKDE